MPTPLESLNKFFNFKSETHDSIRKEKSLNMVNTPSLEHGYQLNQQATTSACIQQKRLHGRARI
jgi:hypothetical protein